MGYIGTEPSLPEGRRRLSALVRQAGDVIRVDDAVRILELSRPAAAKMLARWATQGWLRRAGHGAYVPAGIESLESKHVLDDPWVLVPPLFEPCYVAGRTAAVYWDLTEQIFNDIVVLTSKSIRHRTQHHHGAKFSIRRIEESKIFGLKAVWRGNSRVPVSDVHRTIIDLLDDPSIGGGIQHVADCVNAYLRRSDRDDKRLIEYAERLGNGAVFKRLGYLTEANPTAEALSHACHSRLTKGNAKLDPSLNCPTLVTRWRLWIPAFRIGSARP